MTSATVLLLGLTCLGQLRADPDQFPLALHRSMEIDDYDREIQRQRERVLAKQAQLAATLRLAERGSASREQVRVETADVRFAEARLDEMIAYRNLKAYERDVLGQAVPPDEAQAYALLLDLLQKQEAMAQVEVDFRTDRLRQNQSLLSRRAVSRQEYEESLLDYHEAQANLALSQARQKQVAMELAVRTGDQAYDPAEAHRLKAEYLQASIRYHEIRVAGAQSRLDLARDRVNRNLLPETELHLHQQAHDDAVRTLDAERRKLEELGPPPDADTILPEEPKPRRVRSS